VHGLQDLRAGLPDLSIKVKNRKAAVDFSSCSGCGGCQQRCPAYAIVLKKRDEPIRLYVDPSKHDRKKIEDLCAKAKFNPEQIVCYCTETRAEEVAAAVLSGFDTPEKISRATGIRTGCKVECIQPILRILAAAGIDPVRPDGWQWYGKTPTVWDIPKNVKDKYSKRGFYFDDDASLLDSIAAAKAGGKEAGNA
jgi:bacterioferritin-associated ferredoxin